MKVCTISYRAIWKHYLHLHKTDVIQSKQFSQSTKENFLCISVIFISWSMITEHSL